VFLAVLGEDYVGYFFAGLSNFVGKANALFGVAVGEENFVDAFYVV
jgi:hypothetical protein